ncbi:unnamed protein product, partial [Rodentolepis nana]|uniref:PhoLip_ATPase_C domain-containing protein n=1 Tax=Rodentolepis nana TaxID=102285 RepID=A0A0R3U0M3_RODNA
TYKSWHFWINTFDAIWQSLVIFYIPYIAFNGLDIGINELGTICMNALVFTSLLHVALETKYFTFIHAIVYIGSYLIVYLGSTMVYNAIGITKLSPNPPYFIIFVLMGDVRFWLCMFVTSTLALLPSQYFQKCISNVGDLNDQGNAIPVHNALLDEAFDWSTEVKRGGINLTPSEISRRPHKFCLKVPAPSTSDEGDPDANSDHADVMATDPVGCLFRETSLAARIGWMLSPGPALRFPPDAVAHALPGLLITAVRHSVDLAFLEGWCDMKLVVTNHPTTGLILLNVTLNTFAPSLDTLAARLRLKYGAGEKLPIGRYVEEHDMWQRRRRNTNKLWLTDVSGSGGGILEPQNIRSHIASWFTSAGRFLQHMPSLRRHIEDSSIVRLRSSSNPELATHTTPTSDPVIYAQHRDMYRANSYSGSNKRYENNDCT